VLSPNKTCAICGSDYFDLEVSCICDGCIEQYGNFEFLYNAAKKCNNTTEHKLNSIFDDFFETEEDIEKVLISYIKEKFSEEELKEKCAEIAKNDDVWLYYRILEHKKGTGK
jgi:hypothetical protein